MHITALPFIAKFAPYKVWLKPSGVMGFLYGNHIIKGQIGRITENTPKNACVVVCSMNDTTLGFGVTSRDFLELSKLDPTSLIVINQADIGEYLRTEDE